jgi:hypothetical protein
MAGVSGWKFDVGFDGRFGAGLDRIFSLIFAGDVEGEGGDAGGGLGEDLDVVVGVGDGVAEAEDGLAAFDGFERKGRELEHAGHEGGVGGAAEEQDLGGGAALAEGEEVGGDAALGLVAGGGGVLAAGAAEAEDGALEAEGLAGEADGGAELHHGLVVVAGRIGAFFAFGGRRDEGLGGAGEAAAGFRGAVFGEAEDAKEDALDVAVEHGDGFAEGDGGDGGCGVLADAGEGAEAVGGARELAVELALNELRGAVEEMGAAVVAEAGPEGEHVVFFGLGEGFEGGKAAQELGVALDDGGDARLLEHDLGEPGGVGVADAAPGELAGVEAIPGEELGAEELGLEGERGRRGALRQRLGGGARAGGTRACGFWSGCAGDHSSSRSEGSG